MRRSRGCLVAGSAALVMLFLLPTGQEAGSASDSQSRTLRASQGRWGMHTQSYKLYPKEYVDRVTRFFDQRFTDIPEDVLGLLDAHPLDLGGTYGDPEAGDPSSTTSLSSSTTRAPSRSSSTTAPYSCSRPRARR